MIIEITWSYYDVLGNVGEKGTECIRYEAKDAVATDKINFLGPEICTLFIPPIQPEGT
jgi:hypothetical protein